MKTLVALLSLWFASTAWCQQTKPSTQPQNDDTASVSMTTGELLLLKTLHQVDESRKAHISEQSIIMGQFINVPLQAEEVLHLLDDKEARRGLEPDETLGNTVADGFVLACKPKQGETIRCRLAPIRPAADIAKNWLERMRSVFNAWMIFVPAERREGFRKEWQESQSSAWIKLRNFYCDQQRPKAVSYFDLDGRATACPGLN